MALKDLGRQPSEYPGKLETMAVRLTQVNVVDSDRPDFANDHATALLLHDTCGLKAEYDESGNPVTEVRIQMDPQLDGSAAPVSPGIALLVQSRGSWKPIPPGGVTILERSHLDRNRNAIMAGAIRTGVRDIHSGLEVCHAANSDGTPSLMTVDRERFLDRPEGTRVYRQNRFRISQNRAVQFKGLKEFREIAAGLMDIVPRESSEEDGLRRDDLANNHEGRGFAGVAVRGIEIGEDGGRQGVFAYAKRLELGWNQEQDRRMTPAESVEHFLNNEFNVDWVEEIKCSATEDTFFELIPFQRYNTRNRGLPSHGSNATAQDDSKLYGSPIINEFGGTVYRDDGTPAIGTGYAPSIMVATRKGNAVDFNWLVNRNYRMDRTGPIAPLAEIPTPNLPDDIAAALASRAEQRVEILLELNKEGKLKPLAEAAGTESEPPKEPMSDAKESKLKPPGP